MRGRASLCRPRSRRNEEVLVECWFDGDLDLGPEISAELLDSYGQDGWEVVLALDSQRILLKRRRPDEQRASKFREVQELIAELADED